MPPDTAIPRSVSSSGTASGCMTNWGTFISPVPALCCHILHTTWNATMNKPITTTETGP